MENQLISYLRQYRPFSSEEECLITAQLQQIRLCEDECIFAGDKVCNNLYFICEGVLKIASTNDQGKKAVHFFLQEKQFCTILDSFLNRTKTTDSIEAACKSEVLSISFPALQKIYNELPEFKNLLDQLFQKQLLEKIALRNSYLNHDALGRYRLFIEKQPNIALRVKMQDIASYLGIAPQSLSRLRKQIS